jgi:hypothetical protein
LCMQDNRNSQKIIGVPSAVMAKLTPLIVTKEIFFSSKRSSLSTDGNTIMNLPCLQGLIVFYLLIHPTSFYKTTPISMVRVRSISSNRVLYSFCTFRSFHLRLFSPNCSEAGS